MGSGFNSETLSAAIGSIGEGPVSIKPDQMLVTHVDWAPYLEDGPADYQLTIRQSDNGIIHFPEAPSPS